MPTFGFYGECCACQKETVSAVVRGTGTERRVYFFCKNHYETVRALADRTEETLRLERNGAAAVRKAEEILAGARGG